MAQRYTSTLAQERMRLGLCPECGEAPSSHLDDPRFWLPRRCDLMPPGVTVRIDQYRADAEASR